jgi:hypothetical protein
MGGKLVSSAWAGSIQATAELVVPRSMPTFMMPMFQRDGQAEAPVPQ